jgi:hypothetical protein
VINPSRIRRVGHVVPQKHAGYMNKYVQEFSQKAERKISLRSRSRWENDIKVDIKIVVTVQTEFKWISTLDTDSE